MPESIHDARPRPPEPLLLVLACLLSNATHFTTQPLAFVSVTLSLGKRMCAHFLHHQLSKTSNRDRLSIPEFPYLLSVWYLCKNVPLSGLTHSRPAQHFLNQPRDHFYFLLAQTGSQLPAGDLSFFPLFFPS